MLETKQGWAERLLTKTYYAAQSRFPNLMKSEWKLPAEPIFEQAHPELLYSLAYDCARSYKWTPKSFGREMLQRGAVAPFRFRRRAGALSWRLGTLIWMPVSYVALLFSFALVVSLLLAVVPYGLALLHEPKLEWLASPLESLWNAIGFVVMWIWWSLLDVLLWISTMIIDIFTILGLWPPTALVSLLAASADVLQRGGAWFAAAASRWTFLDVSPVIFWMPASVEEWVHGIPSPWVQSVFHELRIVFGAAVLLGSSIGVLELLFPWLASARAFGWIEKDGKSATIIFCGSTFLDNFMINACVWRYGDPIRHRGFHRAWGHIKPDVEKWLAAAVPDQAEIILSGHSLGGAIAQIAAFDLAPDYSIKLVAAFGSSRIGDPEMRAIYKQRLDKHKNSIHQRSWHITHADDAIPRLPPTRFFNHVGTGFLLSAGGALYQGTRTRIFLDYWTLIDNTGLTRFFFDHTSLTDEEKKYPKKTVFASMDEFKQHMDTDQTWYGQQPQITPLEKFMWNAKILAFTIRDLSPFFFQVTTFFVMLICVFGLLPYYVFAILKGVRYHHSVGRYRDTLLARMKFLERMKFQSQQERQKREAQENDTMNFGFGRWLFPPLAGQDSDLIRRLNHFSGFPTTEYRLGFLGFVKPAGESTDPAPDPFPNSTPDAPKQ